MGAPWSLLRPSLNRPARAAEHAPEGLQIGDRQFARPCAGMVVAVNVACMRAIAAHSERAANRRLCRALGIRPCRIPAEGAHRRPVRHRWRRLGFIVLSKIAGGVDYLPADDGQIGCRVRDLVFRTGEVITIRNDQICELTDLDAPLLALL